MYSQTKQDPEIYLQTVFPIFTPVFDCSPAASRLKLMKCTVWHKLMFFSRVRVPQHEKQSHDFVNGIILIDRFVSGGQNWEKIYARANMLINWALRDLKGKRRERVYSVIVTWGYLSAAHALAHSLTRQAHGPAHLFMTNMDCICSDLTFQVISYMTKL